MNKPESVQPSAEASEGVWPPEPRRGGPPPLFLRVEGMQLTQNGDRLLVVNKSTRRLFAAEVCLFTLALMLLIALPWISYWAFPFHHPTLSGSLPYAIPFYRSPFVQVVFLFMLSLLAGIWCLCTFFCNLGGVTLDRKRGTLKAGGRRERPMSAIKAVLITKTPNTMLGVQHLVLILWDGSRSAGVQTRGCLFGALRREDHAGEVAAIIARFAGVPVRHQAYGKPTTQMIEGDT